MSRFTRAVCVVKRTAGRLAKDEEIRQAAALIISIIGTVLIRVLQRR